jgi:hypothetical protein
MVGRIKESFQNGIAKLKWFASLLSDRLKVELSVIKLLHQSSQMEKRKDDLMREIGQRVFELKEYSDRQILTDAAVAAALAEIEHITLEIEQIRKRASEISKIEE